MTGDKQRDEGAGGLVGSYPIVRLLGHGAMGRVFECTDPVSEPLEEERHVAVKVLRPGVMDDAARLARLRTDADILKSVPSPYVTRWIDVGEDNDTIFVVQELLSGSDLQARLDATGPVPVKEALRYMRDATKGLRAAHTAGIIHGDIKPANLFVDGRRLKIVDFGLSVPVGLLSSSSSLTKGTPAFLAPEVIRGAVADARSDFYSLGCTLFALLVGHPPFTDADITDLLTAHTSELPSSLLTVMPSAPASLVSLMDALLEKSPDRRPATHDDVVARIEAALDDVVGMPGSAATSLAPAPAPASSTVPVTPAANPKARPAPIPFDDPFAAAPSDANIVMGAPTGVVGSLKQMNAIEIVQSLELGRKTAVIDVHPAGGEQGLIGCAGGRVVYAQCQDLVGDQAFYALIGHTDGFFRIHYGDCPYEANIQAPTQFLVLEALRRIDESGADGPGVDGGSPPPAAPAPSPSSPAGFTDLPPTEMSSAPRVRPAARPVEDFDAPTARLPLESTDPDTNAPAPQAPRRMVVTDKSPQATPAEAPSVDDLFDDLRELAATILAGIGRAGAHITGLWTTVVDSLHAAVGRPPALRQVHVVARGPAGLAVIITVVAIVPLLAVLLLARPPFEPTAALAEIDAGHAAAVLADIDEVAPAERTGAEHLMRGHALAALSAPAPAPEGALLAWRDAARTGVVDERALSATLAALKVPDAVRALDTLSIWPGTTIRPRLQALLHDDDFTTRQQARMALQERREFTDADAEVISVADLSRGTTCPQRRIGLDLLLERASTEAALAAIEAASGDRDASACLGRELSAAAKAVRRR